MKRQHEAGHCNIGFYNHVKPRRMVNDFLAYLNSPRVLELPDIHTGLKVLAHIKVVQQSSIYIIKTIIEVHCDPKFY